MSKTVASVLKTARSVVGWNGSNGGKGALISLYNEQVILPAGYKMKITDPWCAAGLTAIFLEAGAGSIFPCECSVDRMFNIAKNVGMIVQPGDERPGDCIVYNWDGNSTLDHVGLLEHVNGNAYVVIECNMHDAVGRRTIHRDAKTIAGFFRPLYSESLQQDEYKVDYARYFSKQYAGKYRVGDTAQFTTGTTGKYMIMDFFTAGKEVQCFGYYNIKDSKIWLYVKSIPEGKVGFIEKGKVVEL